MMSVLGLWILASLLGCSLGYVIVQRPAEYYNYLNQPYAYQWDQYQPYDYQPYNYPSYGNQPYYYQQYNYQPSYYNGYAYYYPITREYPAPHKPDLGPQLPFDEGQKLLQVYRLIRVIELFRTPPKHKKLTSLDQLVQKLTDHTIEEQLVELVYNVEGYEEVAELDRGHEGLVPDPFVDDVARLLMAIQRALNALDLDDYEDHYDHDYHRYQHYNQHHGYAGLPDELRNKLRQLRDLANSLTVEQIYHELKSGGKAKAKEALVEDLLVNLAGTGEGKSLVDEFNANYDVVVAGRNDEDSLKLDNVDKFLIVVDNPQEEPKSLDHLFDEETLQQLTKHLMINAKTEEQPKSVDQQLNEETLDELEAALERYLEEHKVNKAQIVKEKSQEEAVAVLPVAIPTTSPMTTTTTTTQAPVVTTDVAHESWLGSFFGKGNLLPGHQTIDVSEPAVLIEPEAVASGIVDKQDSRIEGETKEEKTPNFEVVQRFQGTTSTETSSTASAVTHSVPLWLLENAEQQKVESKESEVEPNEKVEELPEKRQEPEDVAEDATEAIEEARELPEIKQEPEDEDAAEKADADIRELPEDEEKLQVVEEEEPANQKEDQSTPEPVSTVTETDLQHLEEEITSEAPTAQEDSTSPGPLTVYEVHTEQTPVESREQPGSSLLTTAASVPDARRFVKDEVMKVLNLLEESNGFAELKDHIPDEDVELLVDGLSEVDVGVRWTEMISALQKVVAGKQLENGERIVDVLEHWKEGEEGHLDDGYFERMYGGGENVENRELVDDGGIDLNSNQVEEENLESREAEVDDQIEVVSEQISSNNKTLNGSRILNATVDQIKNNTITTNGNSSSETVVEDRNPRTLIVDDDQEIDHSTQAAVEDETTTSEAQQQEEKVVEEEEVTEKLEDADPQPFPADETESVALD